MYSWGEGCECAVPIIPMVADLSVSSPPATQCLPSSDWETASPSKRLPLSSDHLLRTMLWSTTNLSRAMPEGNTAWFSHRRELRLRPETHDDFMYAATTRYEIMPCIRRTWRPPLASLQAPPHVSLVWFPVPVVFLFSRQSLESSSSRHRVSLAGIPSTFSVTRVGPRSSPRFLSSTSCAVIISCL